MKLEVIGSGSSGNSYILEFDNGDVILLDAGFSISIIKKHLGIRFLKLKAVLITHEHKDHSKAVEKLLEEGIKVYMSEGTSQALGVTGLPRLNLVKHMDNIKITENISVMALKTVHNAKEPLMFTVKDKETKENLVFLTDSSYVDYKFSGFDYYLIEVNYINSIVLDNRNNNIYSQSEHHMSLENAIKLLKASDLSRCKMIVALHLSSNNADESHIKQELKNHTQKRVEIAKAGKEWVLNKRPF